MIKLSDFSKIEPKPFILGAFLSRVMENQIDGKNYFYAYSSFKSSKYVYPDDFSFTDYSNQYIEQLNSHSGWHNWEIDHVSKSNMETRFYICNDLNLPKSYFYDMIYKKIFTSDWAQEESLNANKKEFLRGFLELRGSVDTTAKLLAQDYFYDDKKELKKALILADTLNIAYNYLNFNPRDLQPDFVSGKSKRNTQLRVNLFWYAKMIGFINDYKALVFDKAYSNDGIYTNGNITYYNVGVPSPNYIDARFVSYVNYVTNNIYNKQLNKEKIAQMRKELKLDNNSNDRKARNQILINFFRKNTPDECAICGTKNTFVQNNGDSYFEIHHVISFHNNPKYDNIANLVKLCPTCHSSLKKGRATKEQQIKNILIILNKHPEIYDFCSTTLAIDDKQELASKIQSMLG